MPQGAGGVGAASGAHRALPRGLRGRDLLYLDGPSALETQGRHQQSVETWFAAPAGFVLPNDVTLVGRTLTVQGACGGFGRSLRLSNALTQTIGG